MRPIKAMFATVSVEVPAGTYEDTVFDPSDASVVITFQIDGTVDVTTSAGTTTLRWRSGGSAASFQIRWTNTLGTPSTGPTGTWENFNQSWSVTRTSIGSKTNTATVEIRRVADSAVVASGSITITALVEV